MKYYKDKDNNVFAYKKDGSQDAFIKPNLMLISTKEMQELTTRKPEVDAEYNKYIIKEKIRDATAMIDTLKDAIELGQAKEGDEEKLLQWRTYRISLNQLDPNADFIMFPTVPS